jgi:hypothetical protein
MTYTEDNFKEQAQSGNADAIARWLHQQLTNQDIMVTADLKDNLLEVHLDADPVPDRYELFEWVRNQLTTLEPQGIGRLKIYGRKLGNSTPIWSQECALEVGTYSMMVLPEDIQKKEVSQRESKTGFRPPASSYKLGEARLRLTFWVVGGVLVIWGLAIGIFIYKMVLVKRGLKTAEMAAKVLPESSAESSAELSPNSAPKSAPNSAPKSVSKSVSSSPTPDAYEEALNKGKIAGEMVQNATDHQQWLSVAKQWQEAIYILEEIPKSSPNYKLAQKKIPEYAQNLEYAQKRAKKSK